MSDYRREKLAAQYVADQVLDHHLQARANRGARLVVKTDVRNRIQIKFADNVRVWHRDRPDRRFAPVDFGSREVLLSVVLNPETVKKSSEVKRNRAPQITNYGKDTIEEACALLEKKYGKECAFLTWTLPGSTEEARRVLAEHSSEIVDALLSSMRAELRRARAADQSNLLQLEEEDARYDYVFVWEFQRSGALHLHMCVALGDDITWDVLKRNYRRWWRNILETYSRKTGIDMCADQKGKSWANSSGKWLLECERVKKSVSRYMSKYLSKDASKTARGAVMPPKKFWGVGASLMAELKAYRTSIVVPASDFFKARAEAIKAAAIIASFADSVRTSRDKYHKRECGYVMYFEDAVKDGVFDMLRALLGKSDTTCRLLQMPAVQFGPPDINGQVLAA